MPAVATHDLASLIAEEAAALPAEKQSSVLDYVLFIKQQLRVKSASEEDGDTTWEKIIADPKPHPKLEAFMKAALAEGSEPMNLARF
jgi:hypothetical protein